MFELDELTEIAEREESAEELRLAHVAATRAKQRLLLSGTFPRSSGSPRSRPVRR